ncbi:protein NUCLEAR FUSION DEFECTIVE 6, chloroplastic/mitochondrial-like [Cynara cardunculus var. scolymus]|uniref:protein NUCLEAR FUSION DEFECTIVE 6, chloroplastic/mitochondrial-like n=1 Tax=Cynara cardunculus var. scolymus TaxID=59895 RepID=UPI000D62FD2D|nr:protein NUCLEAR FUSION DEFECTIVE 6, chloroplastic/mitochondrial-like [Cynara cardunculus var. scolymus]XP_024984507.1 protein NUCLEAR FUSION DEFECTIVE 6, chloroplastic/mitochondrial-like [Cynara cardunculus var. scolymus]
MAAVFAGRSVLRSASTGVRSSASRISAGAKPSFTGAARSPFRVPARNPLSHRIFRSPVEKSCVALESMLPFHTATASALLTSMLSSAPYSCGWTIDDS